jgi:alcohol dehydrogenase class IV
MPYVLHANRSAIEPKITELARYLDLKDPSFDAFFDWVVNLRAEIGIAPRLLDIGIDDSDAKLIGEEGRGRPHRRTNPITFSPAQYSALFRNAVNGEFNAIV